MTRRGAYGMKTALTSPKTFGERLRRIRLERPPDLRILGEQSHKEQQTSSQRRHGPHDTASQPASP